MVVISETELAYLAGFVDGEGCVSIGKSGHRYHLMLYVSQLNPEPLLTLREAFGGSLHRKMDNRGYRKQCSWQVSGREALVALETLRPHLRVKREEADAAIEFQRRMMEAPGASREEEIAARQSLYERVRDLKRRSYDHIDFPPGRLRAPDHSGRRLKRLPKVA